MDELRRNEGRGAAELVKQLNKELYLTGWYAVNSNNTHINWTTATSEGHNMMMKKKQIEQEKT